MTASLFIRNLEEHQQVIATTRALDQQVTAAGQVVGDCLRSGGKLMFCGNGGSAADSQHLAAEFTGRFIKDRRPLAALALSTDSSALTCIGNDYSFAEVFSRQIIALGRKGDCLIGISTSGNSPNVIQAVEIAKKIGIVTIGLLGRDGGRLATICDHCVIVASGVTARIQEAHILIGHTLCGAAEQALGFASDVGTV